MRALVAVRALLAVACAASIACGAPAPPAAVAPTARVELPGAVAPAADAAPAPPASSGVAPDAPFRQQPPDATPARPYVPPAPTRTTLRNGIAVVTVPVPSPYVAVRVVAVGGKADGGAASFAALELMASVMRVGTTTRDVVALEDLYVSLMMPDPEIAVLDDGVAALVVGPVSKLKDLAELVADLTLHPSFDEKMFLRKRAQLANGRDQEAADVDRVAERVLLRALFGGHPYGASHRSRKEVMAVKRADLVALHARVFTAPRLSVTVAGGADDKAMLAAVDDAFGAVPGGGGPPVVAPALREPSGAARIAVVDRPGAMPFIEAGFVGPTAGAPDERETFAATEMLTDAVLGKLTQSLRDARGRVPWMACRHLMSSRATGQESFYTRAAPEHVGEVLTEAAAAFRALATAPPSDDDVAAYRERKMSFFAAQFGTAATTAREYSGTFLDGQPLEYVTRRRERLDAVTPAGIGRAAARWLDPSRMRVVVVGDWAALREPLTSLGWGPIELRDADGAVVKVVEAPRGR